MFTITQAQPADASAIQNLLHEYLEWANRKNTDLIQISFDVDVLLQKNMDELSHYMPPAGCLFLARVDGVPVGCVFMHRLAQNIGEVKRMYVQPAFRKQGIGSALIDAIITECRAMGITLLRLDSQRFMTDAHALYRSRGFEETAPYGGAEIPKQFQQHWLFMELAL